MRRRKREGETEQRARFMCIPIAGICGGMIRRRTEPDIRLDALAESIRRDGLLSPVIVREEEGRYALICGARRLAACRMLGWKEIDALCLALSRREAALLYMREHETRCEPQCMDEAELIAKNSLDEEFPRLRRLLALPERVRHAVRRDELTLSQAEPLLLIAGEEKQLEAEQIIAQRALTPAQARRLVAGPGKAQGRKMEYAKDALQEIEALAQRLSASGLLGGMSMHSQSGGICVQILVRK